jgi:hypothetical protein
MIMSEQDQNGLSLEGLAQRLEALERENAELRNEVAELRGSGTRWGEVPALRGADTRGSGEAASAFDGQMSRRSLLSKAGAVAVAAAVGTLLNPHEAKANHIWIQYPQPKRLCEPSEHAQPGRREPGKHTHRSSLRS